MQRPKSSVVPINAGQWHQNEQLLGPCSDAYAQCPVRSIIIKSKKVFNIDASMFPYGEYGVFLSIGWRRGGKDAQYLPCQPPLA